MASYIPNGRQQFCDANGTPLALGTVGMYVVGTTTPANTWQDSGSATLNTNPITLDAGGYANIYGAGSYRQIVKDAAGNVVWDRVVNGVTDVAELSYTPTGTGATAQTVEDRLDNSVGNLFDYVPKTEWAAIEAGTSTLSLDNYLTAALTAKPRIHIPSGNWCFTSFNAGSLGSKTITGDGYPTVIKALGTGDTFTIPNTSGNFTLEHVTFDSASGSARSGGAYINNASGNFAMRAVNMFHGFKGVVNTGTLVMIEDLDMREFAASTGICVQITNGNSIYLTNIRADHSAQIAAGINITNSGDVTMTGINLVHCGTPLLVNPGVGQVVASLLGDQVFCDTSTVGASFDTSGGGSIVRCDFGYLWCSSHTSHGLSINASSGGIGGIAIAVLDTHLTTADGVHIAVAGDESTAHRLGDLVVMLHRAGANTNGAAFSAGNGASDWTIGRAKYGNIDGTGAANKYGVFLGTGCSGKIESGKISGNTTADITGDTSGMVFGPRITGVTTRNSGTATLLSGGTSIVVNHGLIATPTASQIKFWATSNQGSTPLWLDTTTITSTQFTVKTTSAAAANITFGWEASCLGA